MLDDVEQVAVADVFVVLRGVQFQHRRHRDAVLRADLGPLFGGQRRGAFGDQLGQCLVVGAVDRVTVDSRVLGQFRPPGGVEEVAEVLRVVGDHAGHAVLGVHGLVPGVHRRAETGRALRGLERVPGQVLDEVERDQRVGHRDLDPLALAGLVAVHQRREDGVGDGQGGDLVADDGRQVDRLAQRAVRDVDQAGSGLHGLVVGGVARAVGVAAEALRVGVDEAGVPRGDVGVVHAEPAQRTRAHVRDQHVGGVDQLERLLALLLVLQVEGDTALVAVHVQVERRHARRRPELADPHGVGRGLDLDHVGAEVAEDLRGVRAHDHRRKVDHANAVQRSGSGLSHFASLRRCSLYNRS